MSLKVGETKNVTVDTVPADASDHDEVLAALTFSSDSEANATFVKAEGNATATVTAVKDGKAKGIVKSGKLTAELDITVKPAE